MTTIRRLFAEAPPMCRVCGLMLILLVLCITHGCLTGCEALSGHCYIDADGNVRCQLQVHYEPTSR